MSVRDERAAAIRKRVGNGLADNLPLVLPLLLDDLDAIDRAQVPGPIGISGEFTDEQLAELRSQLDDLAAKRAEPAVTRQAAAPAKPATRRRAAPK